MQLDQLFPDILSLSPDEQLVTISMYQNKRQRDLNSAVIIEKKKEPKVRIPKNKGKIAVSPDDLQLLKKLKLI